MTVMDAIITECSNIEFINVYDQDTGEIGTGVELDVVINMGESKYSGRLQMDVKKFFVTNIKSLDVVEKPKVKENDELVSEMESLFSDEW